MRTSLLQNPREGEHLENLSVDGRIILKSYKIVPIEFIWPRIGISGGHL